MSRIAKAAVVTAAAGAVLAGGAGMAAADAGAQAAAVGSPGVLSGDLVQVPVHVPVNLCGDTIDVIGLLDPAFGQACANVSQTPDQAPVQRGGYGSGGYGSDR